MTPAFSTPALVLHTTPYSETSVVAKFFTRELGVRSYILKGVRKGSGRTKQNLLQPLSYLDTVVYANPKTSLNYVKEIAPHINEKLKIKNEEWGGRGPNSDDEAVRNAVVFFMTELLYKTLRDEEPDEELFDYVVDALQKLREPVSSQHSQLPVLFMLRLTRYLGIEPLDNYSQREPRFNLTNGRFQFAGETMLDADTSQLLHYYLQAIHNDTPCPLATLKQRITLINSLLDYFQLHLAEFRNFTSHEILHSVLQ